MGERVKTVLSDNNVDKLKAVNSKKSNGFLVLLDIKDSTKRKTEYQEKWPTQTEVLYDSFRDFFRSLKKELRTDDPIIKFIGDGMMAFYPSSFDRERAKNQECVPENARFLVNKTMEYINGIHDEDEFCGLKLKSVITYLTGIHIIKKKHPSESDVLGRGIDFSFRLEKFADITHIVVNSMIAEAFAKYESNGDEQIEEAGETNGELHQISCRRKLRGWDDPNGEQFYLLSNQKMIADNIKSVMPSVYSDNVVHDLFRFYVMQRDQEPPTDAEPLIQKTIETFNQMRKENGDGDGR